jgi:ribosomal protein S27AE
MVTVTTFNFIDLASDIEYENPANSNGEQYATYFQQALGQPNVVRVASGDFGSSPMVTFMDLRNTYVLKKIINIRLVHTLYLGVFMPLYRLKEKCPKCGSAMFSTASDMPLSENECLACGNTESLNPF